MWAMNGIITSSSTFFLVGSTVRINEASYQLPVGFVHNFGFTGCLTHLPATVSQTTKVNTIFAWLTQIPDLYYPSISVLQNDMTTIEYIMA